MKRSAPSEVDAGPGARRVPPRGGRPAEREGGDPHGHVDVEDVAPGGGQEIRRRSAQDPQPEERGLGPDESRMAAPRNGPAAIPRKVSAPITPSARGRAWPSNRCEAAAVATGTSAPPPSACTARAAMSWSSPWASPASSEPTVKQTSAPRKRRRAPQRSARRPARGIVPT